MLRLRLTTHGAFACKNYFHVKVLKILVTIFTKEYKVFFQLIFSYVSLIEHKNDKKLGSTCTGLILCTTFQKKCYERERKLLNYKHECY